jgi:hypothetical protein
MHLREDGQLFFRNTITPAQFSQKMKNVVAQIILSKKPFAQCHGSSEGMQIGGASHSTACTNSGRVTGSAFVIVALCRNNATRSKVWHHSPVSRKYGHLDSNLSILESLSKIIEDRGTNIFSHRDQRCNVIRSVVQNKKKLYLSASHRTQCRASKLGFDTTFAPTNVPRSP